jgi:hypothetical protein
VPLSKVAVIIAIASVTTIINTINIINIATVVDVPMTALTVTPRTTTPASDGCFLLAATGYGRTMAPVPKPLLCRCVCAQLTEETCVQLGSHLTELDLTAQTQK